MIGELIAYAERKGLGEPGIVAKAVKYAICLPAEGTEPWVVEIGAPSEKKNPGLEFACCPDTPGMNSGGKAHFLADTLRTVVGLGDEDGKQEDRRHFFIDLLRESATVLPDALRFAELLEDEAMRERLLSKLLEKKAKPTDKVTLRVEDRDPPFLLEDDSWRFWWAETKLPSLAGGSRQKSGKRRKKGAGMRCFATGELVEPAATHPKITSLADVGASSMGALLVSFDKDALCSYGLKKSTNSAMSGEAAAKYAAAFNEIAHRHAHRQAGSKVLCWFDRDIPAEDNPASWLETGVSAEKEERQALARARDLFRSARDGRRPDLASASFFCLTASGNAGRVVVRDWIRGSYEELASNTLAWFDDLSVIARDGRQLVKPPKFLAVVGGLVRELKDAPRPLVDALWRTAIRGREYPIPETALAQAVARFRVDIVQDNPSNHARMGLIKAYHIRKGDSDMAPGLNQEHSSPAYHCGRLMAVLAQLQYRALGDVGAGVVQRYYAAASSTPALVLGRLTRNSRFHIEKLGKENRGLARYFDKRFAEIWQALDPDHLPATLTLTEQSLFAMGYYHQQAWRKADEEDTPGSAGEAGTVDEGSTV